MALNGLILDQRNNTSKNWRNILAEVFGDGILNGCGITSTSNSITVGGGYFVLKGNVIENNGAETIAVTPELTNGYIRLRCRIDLTQEASDTGAGQVKWMIDFSATATFPALTQEDINSTGSIYEGEIAVCGLVAGNITTVTRKIGEAVIDAEKLGGQLPKYYTGLITAAQNTANAAIPKAGGTFSGSVTTQNISPSINNTYVLGSANQRYRDAYFFTQHLDSMLAFEGTGAEWKEIRALTTLAFRKSDAPATKINIDAANVQAPSSARYKENIQNVTEADALKILKLRPVSYDYKPESGYEGSSKAFVADEAAEVDERYVYRTAHITEPEVSHVDEKTGETIIDEPAVYEMRIEGLNQNPIICDLVALCQRQQKQIDDLTARVEKLEAKIK